MTRGEAAWVLRWAAVVIVATCVPYLYAATLGPDGTVFSGLICGFGDHCVYLSWAQQAAQGHFLMRNLFTGDAQRGLYIHLFSWLEGSVERLTGVPLVLVHHGFRCLFAGLLLALAYRLCALFTTNVTTRRAAFWFTAVASGFGWIRLLLPPGVPVSPVDQSQAEATTFLCLYSNGLFCAALCLMVGIFLLLLQAEARSGRARWGRVAGAGVLGLFLGNIHSYDVLTVTAVWIAYLVLRGVEWQRGRAVASAGSRGDSRDGTAQLIGRPQGAPLSPGGTLVNALAAGLIALPSTAYQYYLYRTEPVFRMRADSPTLSPPVWDYLLGYGLVLLLAIGGAVVWIRTAHRGSEPLGNRLFPLAWAITGFMVPYLPFAFQRKLVMGLHLPLALLAAVGAVALARSLFRGAREPAGGRRVRATRRSAPDPAGPRQWAQGALVFGLVLLCTPTNWLWVRRDIQIAPAMGYRIPGLPCYLPLPDVEAMRWMGEHVPEDALILASEESGCLIPALAGRRVYSGHWSETPYADRRREEAQQFFENARATPEERLAFLAERKIRYVYLGTMERSLGAADLTGSPRFRPVYRHRYVAVYEILPSITAGEPAAAGEWISTRVAPRTAGPSRPAPWMLRSAEARDAGGAGVPRFTAARGRPVERQGHAPLEDWK